ncbi:MAG: OmpA family protein [Endomicrobiales bacterium]|jgi:chemotaxis protein MotB
MALKSRKMIDYADPRVSKIGHPAPPWLINYADLMTELVCFFIILYALSASLSKSMQDAKDKMQKQIKQEQMQAEVKMNKEGMTLSLEEQPGSSLFESGKADITPHGKDVIEKFVPIFMNLPNEIVVEGHTDDVPIHNSQFDSNWELSTARATNIVKFLVHESGFPPKRLSAVGYGEFKPIAPNDTPENRAKNRRVVFFIKKK